MAGTGNRGKTAARWEQNIPEPISDMPPPPLIFAEPDRSNALRDGYRKTASDPITHSTVSVGLPPLEVDEESELESEDEHLGAKIKMAQARKGMSLSSATTTRSSLEVMDGACGVNCDDWAPFMEDIGPFSTTNLPRFFRKLRQNDAKRLQRMVDAGHLEARELGIFWGWNFDKDGKSRHTESYQLIMNDKATSALLRTNTSAGLPMAAAKLDAGAASSPIGEQVAQRALEAVSKKRDEKATKLEEVQARLQELERCQLERTAAQSENTRLR
ncbi:hypothetical protein FQN49_002576 [Arthroderma sp. PD_2]|nr:hypothetical protein FQN49_002576 [Arthroderma sp. PD_2]